MADGEHATMDARQATAVQALVDQVLAEAEIDQLSPGDHPVLAFGKLPDRRRRDPTRCNVFFVK